MGKKPAAEPLISADEDVPLTGIAFPWFMGQTRKDLENFYPGPTIMMHKMHYTEWVFIIFLLSSAGITVACFLGMLSIAAIGGFSTFVSVSATVNVWGIAKYQNLADVASELEEQALENRRQINFIEGINDEWENAIAESGNNLQEFTATLGLVGDDASKIDECQKALSALVKRKQAMLKEEKALFIITSTHQEIMRAEIREKQRTIMKSSLSHEFDRLMFKQDADEAHEPHEGGEGLSGQYIDELVEVMKTDAFLKDYKWQEHFKSATDDGLVEKWELLDTLDSCTESFYLNNRNAIREQAQKEKELRAWNDKRLLEEAAEFED